MYLLYAEDEITIAEAVEEVLKKNNYLVDVVNNGNDALDYALEGKYDGIILDVMMPGMSGLEVLKALRRNGSSVPVLLLTAKSQVSDKVEGLDSGADDYLAKPFAMKELSARVRAMLRRPSNFEGDLKQFGDIFLNTTTFELSCGNNKESLINLEYRLMETFMINSNQYLSAETLFDKVWGYDSSADIGTVWAYISRIRKKLENIGSRVRIDLKRNIGYKMAYDS